MSMILDLTTAITVKHVGVHSTSTLIFWDEHSSNGPYYNIIKNE